MPDWKLGQRCVITDTANVLSRCPELVGSVGPYRRPGPKALFLAFERPSSPCSSLGEITGLPTATSNCYDVAVTDGRVIKFQPSALRAAASVAPSSAF